MALDNNEGAVADVSHISASTERPATDIDLSDDLLSKYLDGDADTGGDRGRAPAKTGKTLSSSGKDTRASAGRDSELDDDDTDLDDVEEGDEDGDEELDRLLGEDDDEEESDEDESDEESDEEEEEEAEFLSEFNRQKFLKKYGDNPDVMAAYKSFQADYTRAMQGFKQKEVEWQGKLEKAGQMEEQYKTFASQLSDDEGMSDFLVNVALHRPEVFDKAYERALSLNEDEGQKSQYLKDQDLKEREAKLEREEAARKKQAQIQRINEIESLYQRAANRLGLKTPAHLKIAERFVATAIREARDEGKQITNEQVVAAVKEAAAELGITREQARKEAERELRNKRRSETRAKARDSRRPQPPRGGKAVDTKRKEEEPKRKRTASLSDDPLDSHIDSFFSRA